MDGFRKEETTSVSQGRPSLPSATFLGLCHIKKEVRFVVFWKV